MRLAGFEPLEKLLAAMKITPRVVVTSVLAFAAIYAAAFSHGAWTERNDWRNAREIVIRDLARKGLDAQGLGPTEIIENEGQPLSYGFSYDGPTAKYDYVVHYGGPRGVEISVWDYSRTD